MAERVQIDGLSDLMGALRALPDATAKNVLRRVARKRLQPIVDHAKSLVPVDKGALRNSLVVSSKLSKRQRQLRGSEKEGAHDIEMYAGAGPLPAAHLQEFGSSQHAPQPFMRRAWDAKKQSLVDGLKDDLWQEIEKAAKRHARKMAKLAQGA
jgi:HK97 gp10 family phage protein